MNRHYCAALLACSGFISSCGLWSRDSTDDAPGFPTAGAPTTGFGGASGSGTNADNGGATQGGSAARAGVEEFPIGYPCEVAVPVTSQIPRLLNRQYEAVMRDLLGITSLPGEGSSGDVRLSDLLVGDDPGLITAAAWAVYQDVGARLAHAVMTGPNKSKFISCDPAQAGCLDDTIKSFGRKAFRRPLTDDEVARFQKLGQTTPAPTPDELAETTLLGFLISPSFLMLPELATDKQFSGKIQLSSHEVATRLSIMLWGSIPDDELNAAADKEELQTKEQILVQAQRMLANREKTAPMIDAFHQRWTHADDNSGHWWKAGHDTAQFPLYTPDAASALQAEMNAFFEDIAFGHGTFQDYFLSNTAFVNRDTAGIYGLDSAGFGAGLKRVKLDEKERPGFVTRAGFLSSYSNYGQSSPFLRGAFIAQDLVGIALPPPIPDFGSRRIMGDFKTNREYQEELTSVQPCRSCHEVFNPLGYALENFDAIGAWQTTDQRGGAIDATATVNLGNGLAPLEVSSPRQLMEAIAQAPRAQQLYLQTWISFAYGRPSSIGVGSDPPAPGSDNCLIDALKTRLSSTGYEVLSIPADLTQADPFRMRVRGTL